MLDLRRMIYYVCLIIWTNLTGFSGSLQSLDSEEGVGNVGESFLKDGIEPPMRQFSGGVSLSLQEESMHRSSRRRASRHHHHHNHHRIRFEHNDIYNDYSKDYNIHLAHHDEISADVDNFDKVNSENNHHSVASDIISLTEDEERWPTFEEIERLASSEWKKERWKIEEPIENITNKPPKSSRTFKFTFRRIPANINGSKRNAIIAVSAIAPKVRPKE